MATAINAASFIDSLGINTHLDFATDGYQNLSTVESAIRYLGLINLRDSAQAAGDATLWQQVAQATGAKFDDYIAETSPSGMRMDLSHVAQLAGEGILNYLEGGNEEDDAYPASLGNTLAITAQFQRQVFATGHQLGLPVINMSFGAGWTAANNWQGDYGEVGNLAAYADYGNAHTYANPGQLPDDTMNRLNGLANLAAAGRSVMTTELGWNENAGFSQSQIAKYALDAALDGIKDGDAKTYFYALFNDVSGNYGLMNQNGTPKPAGAALHNLTTLLADSGAFAPGSLNYTLSNSDNTLLMQKSDGSYWLSVWNETAGSHSVTLTLPSAAGQIRLFDPLTGTSATQTASNTTRFTFTVPDHPVIVEIAVAAGGSSPGSTGGGSGSSTGGSSGSGQSSGGSTGSGGSGTPDPVITLPASQTMAAGSTASLANLSIADPWAAANPGSLALTVAASGGTIAMTNDSGSRLAGSGTGTIQIGGTLAQINADLATLSYTAGNSDGSVSIDIWDQAGVEATRSATITIGQQSTGSSSGSSTIVQLVSNATIVAPAGDHLIFIGGTGDKVTATGGAETVQAFLGGNAITTGASNDTIQFAGSGNVIDAGAGNNVLADSGSGNTVVLPAANQGYDDIYGYVLDNGDRLDLRSLLAGTDWNGGMAGIGNVIKLTASGNSAVISVDPSGTASGATYAVAQLEDSGAQSLNTLLAHSITS